jgi:RNA polymerase sigma-70 factor (ECF subfamily)
VSNERSSQFLSGGDRFTEGGREERAIPSRRLDPERLGDHIDRLYRAAWGLCGSREDAEDLVQETYAKVLARPRLLRREHDLAYLLRALRNTFLAARRPQSARAVTVPLDEELDAARAGGQAGPSELAEQRRVYGAIAALAPDYRDALVAVDVAGLSYREAARALRVPEGTVTSRLSRARERVADALD